MWEAPLMPGGGDPVGMGDPQPVMVNERGFYGF